MTHASKCTKELTGELFRRSGDAVAVKRIGDQFGFEGYNARKGHCHKNVEQWVKEHPLDQPVHGWLVNQSQLEEHGFVAFYAHSLIRAADNGLVDVTLGASDFDYRFLPDERPDNEFMELTKLPMPLQHIDNQARFDAYNASCQYQHQLGHPSASSTTL
ncbi:hypothetical protein [Paraburkholderia hayleyella]|uniref:hypothetical protein n=1 Tax=Paraburkholderia hayleyella TaxID=2152889 RepID=UPI0012917F90|nr:hypothetical protein [Paraburkholderia hayleyella]